MTKRQLGDIGIERIAEFQEPMALPWSFSSRRRRMRWRPTTIGSNPRPSIR